MRDEGTYNRRVQIKPDVGYNTFYKMPLSSNFDEQIKPVKTKILRQLVCEGEFESGNDRIKQYSASGQGDTK